MDTPRPSDDAPRSVFELDPDSLRAVFAQMGQPGFRSDQVLEWVYRRPVATYAEMSNLPKTLREKLEAQMPIYRSKVVTRQDSRDGTMKLLLEWPDKSTSECVRIPGSGRFTACISTQVGCPVGCRFCASGIGGLQRNLTAGEIIEQAMQLRLESGPDEDLTNVVFMGLGEPLANYDATVKAVRTINAPWGLGIGARKITVSTVGLASQIRRLADEEMQITLALSLHAPTDALRSELIPWAANVSIESLTDACRYYFEKTGREVTLEYVLLGGVNDSVGQANQVASVAKSIRSNVNLLVYNPVDGLGFDRPDDDTVERFRSRLRSKGVNVHVRASRGRDIDAACGQLRRKSDEATKRRSDGGEHPARYNELRIQGSE